MPAAPELTVNKVLAGAGAAATSAVFGSFFGAAGTIAGAALGSVASTVATAIYQHSLDRTRDTLVSRIRVNGRNVEITRIATPGSATAGSTASLSHASDEPTVLLPPAELSPAAREARTVLLPVEPALASRPPHRRWSLWIGATVLVFVMALAGVTGLEWIKGSTLTAGESGTSVGRVLDPRPASAPAEEEEETTPTPEPSEGAESTDESDESDGERRDFGNPEPSGAQDEPVPEGSGEAGGSGGSGDPNSGTGGVGPTSTPPEPGGR